MGKTRVYELAQKHGLDNKTTLDRLKAVGVDAKTHMSMLEEEDIQKFEADSSPTVEKVVEKRISSGLIRRRRKEVPQPQDAVASAGDEEPAEIADAAAETAEEVEAGIPEASVEAAPVAKSESVAEPEPVVEPEVPVEAPEVSSMEEENLQAEAAEPTPAAPEEPVAEEKAPEAPVAAEGKTEPAKEVKEEVPAVEKQETPAAAVKTGEPRSADTKKPAKLDKPTASRAKILGRVELPTPGRSQAPASRSDARNGRTAVEISGRPGRPAGDKPTGERPSRPARPSGPSGQAGQAGRPGAPVAPAGVVDALPGKEPRGGKKRKKGKGAELAEAGQLRDQPKRRGRREVFEPDHDQDTRYRKAKRGGRQAPKKAEPTMSKAIKRIIRISDSITVGELAKRMGIKANDLIKEMMRQGNMVTINHPLDYETAALLASDFHYEVENIAFDEETLLVHTSDKTEEEQEGELEIRPPVVTIMGHVDHGKTSLLDAIRAANVTEGEAGGITQHIGAYDVELDGRKITFLDTPGHEAFTSMRARGAKVTDIVILVVAADDGVMPQTKEAINHSKAAGVPIIVAVNKIDKPDANPERVKQELTEFELVPEEWGGDTIFVEVSAKQHTNLEQLLEMVLLQAEVLELKANPGKRAKGTIVEARLDKGRGPVATVLVQDGTMRIGDPIVAGTHFGRVRTMTDDRGMRVQEAGPSFPVEVTGLSGVPDAGDLLYAVEDEKSAKEVAQHRSQKLRETELAKSSKISLEQLYARIQQGDVKELRVIIKGDVQGSVEAVKDALVKLSTDSCRLIPIHAGVGGIIESDVTLASASDAIVLGFNVRPEPKANSLAEIEGVDIRLYNIIYDAVADIRDAMEGMLAPTLKEKALGRVEVRETFVVTKIGTIAGCYVLDGKILRGAQVRLVRDNVVVWTGKLASLKRFKDDVREVNTGYECGIGLENYNDIKVGDIIEVFEMEEVKTRLEGA